MDQEKIVFEFMFFCESCGYERKDNTHYYVGGGIPENGILPMWIFTTWERKDNEVIGNPSPPAYCDECEYQMMARWMVDDSEKLEKVMEKSK